jgi:hypothetical protein
MPPSTRTRVASVASSLTKSATNSTKNRKSKHEDEPELVPSESEADTVALDSDALDDDEDEFQSSRKRRQSSKKSNPPRKKKKRVAVVESDEDNFELKDGQEIVGVIVKAPVTGRGMRSVFSLCFAWLSEIL